jgi:hypothetical protein
MFPRSLPFHPARAAHSLRADARRRPVAGNLRSNGNSCNGGCESPPASPRTRPQTQHHRSQPQGWHLRPHAIVPRRRVGQPQATPQKVESTKSPAPLLLECDSSRSSLCRLLSVQTASLMRMGSLRTRLPVAAKIALATAGAAHGTPGSPMPPGFSSLRTTCTSISGVSFMRNIG